MLNYPEVVAPSIASNPAITKYFISGLPRAGSSLLSALLTQNPLCHAGVASPLSLFLNQLLHTPIEGFALPTAHDRISIAKKAALGLVEAYYTGVDRPIIFDSNRCWAGALPLLKDIYPDTKVICCVRNLSDILNSFERVYQENRWTPASPVYAGDTATVYHRCDNLMKWDGAVGTGLTNLKEGLHHPLADDMLFILEYDDLAKHPQEAMNAIYSFLGMEEFNHDVNSISQIPNAETLDRDLSLIGLHHLRSSVSAMRRHQYIPRDIVDRYSGLEYWRQLHASD